MPNNNIQWDDEEKDPLKIKASDNVFADAMGLPPTPAKLSGVKGPDGQPIEYSPFYRMSQGYVQALPGFGGGITNVVGKVANPLAKWLGGKLAALATGARELAPEAEQVLVNQGLIGTKNMMQKQVTKKLVASGERLGNAAREISGGFETKPVAEAVQKVGSKLEIAPGTPTEAVKPAWERVQKRAADIAQRGSESGTPGVQSAQGLQRGKVIAGSEGFTQTGLERAGIDKAAARAENAAVDDMLEKAYAEQHPGLPNEYKLANTEYGALKEAERGLGKKRIGLAEYLSPLKGVLVDPALSAGAQATRLVKPTVGALDAYLAGVARSSDPFDRRNATPAQPAVTQDIEWDK